MGNQRPAQPAGLAARGRALWHRVHADYELDAVEDQLLEELCRCLDFGDRLRRELAGAKSLMTLGSTGAWRISPLVVALQNQTKLADRLASSLGVSMPGSAGAGKGAGHQRKASRTRWNRAAKGAPVVSIVGDA